METHKIKSWKEGACLFFERDGKRLEFDFRDNRFYRILKTGVRKAVDNARPYFKNLSPSDIVNSFDNPVYRKYVDLVSQGEHRLTNLASLFENLEKYKHLEGYLALGIEGVNRRNTKLPVTIYNKEVLQFLLEARITITDNTWENAYANNQKIVTDICTYIRANHHLALDIYRMVYKLICSYDFGIFKALVTPSDVVVNDQLRYNYNYNNRGRTTTGTNFGYGCEYKTLLEYLIKIDRTEAMDMNSSVGYYRDYLKMTREMTYQKYWERILEQNPNAERCAYKNLGYNKIEKYPSHLRTKHDVVARNYNDFCSVYDEALFTKVVNKDYEYKWGKYQIVAPTKTKDIRDEGCTLNHCVASYIDRVLDGNTQILFMRENSEESLVTIEVRSNSIVQARGYSNRSLNNQEAKWLETYAKAKNLSYGKIRRDENLPTPYIKPETAEAKASEVSEAVEVSNYSTVSAVA